MLLSLWRRWWTAPLLAASVACSTPAARPSAADAAAAETPGADAADDGGDARPDAYYPIYMDACMVQLEDPANPCAPTFQAMLALTGQNGFEPEAICVQGPTLFAMRDARGLGTSCLYGFDGALIAWERVSATPDFCDGTAYASSPTPTTRSIS